MQDIYEAVTARIIRSLESGVPAWSRPWTNTGGSPVPHNATTNRRYSGINALLLWIESLERGYSASAWLTFKQAKEQGGHVRKGEAGTPIVFWKMLEKDTDEVDAEGNPEKKLIPMARMYYVFNVDQCEGLPQHVEPAKPQDFEHVERFTMATAATIEHGGDRAYYRPEADKIRLPNPQQFTTAGDYYSTQLHELTHWTGHPSRLARDLHNRFGDEAYAAEELIAELGSAFLCAHLGIDGKLQHAEYIDHWLKILHEDKRAIFTAASAAQKAADYLIALQDARPDLAAA